MTNNTDVLEWSFQITMHALQPPVGVCFYETYTIRADRLWVQRLLVFLQDTTIRADRLWVQ